MGLDDINLLDTGGVIGRVNSRRVSANGKRGAPSRTPSTDLWRAASIQVRQCHTLIINPSTRNWGLDLG